MKFTPEYPQITDPGVTGLAVPDRGIVEPTGIVTSTASRSTPLIDSPPEFATHNVLSLHPVTSMRKLAGRNRIDIHLARSSSRDFIRL